MSIWSLSEVLEFVEHPERRVRCGPPASPEQQPFLTINQLGKTLSRFSPEDQEMYVSNFMDTLDDLT